MNTFINAQITVVRNTLDSLNKNDTLTAKDIKKINNTLASALTSIEATMADFIEKSILKNYKVKLIN